MPNTPLFDETGHHCLRSVQGEEEGFLLLKKIEAGNLKSCSLGDVLKIIDRLNIPIESVIGLIGEAKVILDETS